MITNSSFSYKRSVHFIASLSQSFKCVDFSNSDSDKSLGLPNEGIFFQQREYPLNSWLRKTWCKMGKNETKNEINNFAYSLNKTHIIIIMYKSYWLMSASSFLFHIEFEFYLKNSLQLSVIGWIDHHPDTCTLLSPDAKHSKIKCKKNA